MTRTNVAAEICFEFLSLCLRSRLPIHELRFLEVGKLVVQEEL